MNSPGACLPVFFTFDVKRSVGSATAVEIPTQNLILKDDNLDAFKALKVTGLFVVFVADSGSHKSPEGGQEEGEEDELHTRDFGKYHVLVAICERSWL